MTIKAGYSQYFNYAVQAKRGTHSEAKIGPEHVYILVEILPSINESSFVGYLQEKVR